jgi:putative effector of murein hydrolase
MLIRAIAAVELHEAEPLRRKVAKGIGIGKVAKTVGLGVGTVHRLKREGAYAAS